MNLKKAQIQSQKSEKLTKATSGLLNLSEDEKKQVIKWLDLERNAPILQKTDKAIAAKLSGKTAALTLGGAGSGINIKSSNRAKTAAQVLINSGTDLSDIDSVLGIDDGLDEDNIVFEDPILTTLGIKHF